jgi:hypothetical protein
MLWWGVVHDCMRGAVTALALTSDVGEERLISGAADGSLLLLASPCDGVLGVEASQGPLPPLAVPTMAYSAGPEAEDITDPNALTLEAAAAQRLQLEREAEAAAARTHMLAHIAGLRARFEELRADNDAAPPEERLPESAFHEIDRGGHAWSAAVPMTCTYLRMQRSRSDDSPGLLCRMQSAAQPQPH